MRQQVPKVVADYDQERARWSAVTREDIAQSTRWAYDGTPVGSYREGDALLPIIARNVEEDRARVSGELDVLQVQPTLGLETIPLGQVTDRVDVVWEDPIIHRWNRRRAETVDASPIDGETFPSLYGSVIEAFEELEASLPPGYQIFWDGEYDSTATAQGSLIPGLIPAAVIIFTIIVLLYNSIRVLLCILLTVPFAGIGVIFGLIALANRVAVADHMPLGDAETIPAATRKAVSLASAGLEEQSRLLGTSPAEVLVRARLEDLFRLGVALEREGSDAG